MTDALRRKRYVESRVLIETGRVLSPQFLDATLYITGAELELLRNMMAYLNRESTFVSEYGDGYYLTPTVAEWDALQAIVAHLEEMLMGEEE